MTIDQQTITEQVQMTVAKALNVPAEVVTAELQFGDIPQWDSMGHMEVMLWLETDFSVEITNETIADLTSVPAICSYIKDKR